METSYQNDPGLPPIILKLDIDIISPNFHNLLTQLWQYGCFPQCLKKDTKIFIPKPGKDDYNRGKEYRILTLSPCIAKIYDSIFAERFYKWLKKLTLILTNLLIGDIIAVKWQ